MLKLTLLLLLPLQVFCDHIDHRTGPATDDEAVHRHHQLKETSAAKRHYLRDAEPSRNNAVGNRFRRGAMQDLYVEPPITWSYLRRFICGTGDSKCMNDERLNNLQPDLLRKLSRMSDFKAPSNANDLIPRRVTFPTEFSTNDVDIWRSLNLSGRREGPLYVEEPDFVVRGESENHAQLFGYADDPFIPQRGRKNDISQVEVPLKSRLAMLLSHQLQVAAHTVRRPQQSLNQNKETNTLTMTSHYNGKKKINTLMPATVLYNGNWENNGNDDNHATDDDDYNEMLNTIPSQPLDGNYYFNANNSAERNKRNLPPNNLSQAGRDTFYLTRGRRGAAVTRTALAETPASTPAAVANR